ncbi:MAG: hypothetical protein ILP22_04375, partial [Oscillospiraceae bacterium]|nr:hypothetical protein [Oscillospiraceae bacterium]
QYKAGYAGKDDAGRAIYSCVGKGSYTTYIMDRDSEDEERKTIYTNGSAEFIFDHGTLCWHDMEDEFKTYWEEIFIKSGD